jgi:hydrogenase expression/formation protein HypC
LCLAVPGKIIEIYEAGSLKMGKVDFGGVIREACMAYVPEAKVGDFTIIHAGFAISLLNDQQAQDSLETWREILDKEDELNTEVVGSDQK